MRSIGLRKSGQLKLAVAALFVALVAVMSLFTVPAVIDSSQTSSNLSEEELRLSDIRDELARYRATGLSADEFTDALETADGAVPSIETSDPLGQDIEILIPSHIYRAADLAGAEIAQDLVPTVSEENITARAGTLRVFSTSVSMTASAQQVGTLLSSLRSEGFLVTVNTLSIEGANDVAVRLESPTPMVVELLFWYSMEPSLVS